MFEYRLKRIRSLEPDLGGEQYDYRHTEQELANLSLDGWEAVSIAPGSGEWVVLLKRPAEGPVVVDMEALF